MYWRGKWQPTPVFLPRESQGQGSLVGCRLWGHTESDTRSYLAAAVFLVRYFHNIKTVYTADGDCSHEIKRRLLLGRKVMTNLDSIFKSEVSQSCRLFVTPWTVACPKLLCPWDFQSKSTGMGCHFLLQGISQPRDRTQVSHIVDRRFTI